MKVAVIYNRESKSVINLFGVPNRKKYGQKKQSRGSWTRSCKVGGHRVIALEGDKDLIDPLEEFMPRVMKHERPGMVFNLSPTAFRDGPVHARTRDARDDRPPLRGFRPLAHSLALDKVVSKMIFVQHGLPTPEFAVLEARGFSRCLTFSSR